MVLAMVMSCLPELQSPRSQFKDVRKPRVVEDALMRRPPGEPGGSEAETGKDFHA